MKRLSKLQSEAPMIARIAGDHHSSVMIIAAQPRARSA
jgi:hypothetical protein